MAEADGKIVVGFEAKADAAQAAAEGKRMAESVRRGAESANLTRGSPNLASGGKAVPVGETEAQTRARARIRREKLNEEIRLAREETAAVNSLNNQRQRETTANFMREQAAADSLNRQRQRETTANFMKEQAAQAAAREALNRQRQRETTANFTKDEALRSKTQRILQEQMGLIPPKLSSIPTAKTASLGMQGISALAATGVPYVSTLARAVFSPIGGAAAGLALQFVVLRRTMREYADAAALYAKILRSGGMAPDYVAGRANLAKIIGVSEEEVMNYAQAVQMVGQKAAQATRIQAEGVRIMTATEWELRTLGMNFKSLWTVIAQEASPAVQTLASAMNNITMAAVEGAKRMAPLMHFMPGASGILAGASVFAGGVFGQAPMAPPNISRTPTTAWEKMGLSMGFGGGPIAMTANNTRRTAVGVEAIKQGLDKLAERLGAAMEKVGLAVKEPSNYP